MHARHAMQEAGSYRIDTDIEIEATAEQVWKVFGDFKHWGRWNKFVMFKAEPKVHERCRIGFLHKDGRKSSTFNPEIMELYPNRILLWRDKGPITSCLLHSTHWFALYADGPASSPTLFSHGAAMSGPGLRLPWLLLSMNATRWRFEKFNQALKKEVEAQVLRDKYLSQGRNADGRWPQDEPATPEAPQQKAHKLQGHRSFKNLWGLGGSCKQSAGTVRSQSWQGHRLEKAARSAPRLLLCGCSCTTSTDAYVRKPINLLRAVTAGRV